MRQNDKKAPAVQRTSGARIHTDPSTRERRVNSGSHRRTGPGCHNCWLLGWERGSTCRPRTYGGWSLVKG
ncbi:hypothetical protein GCM10010174_44790 [Kutzneria viridogrisea]